MKSIIKFKELAANLVVVPKSKIVEEDKKERERKKKIRKDNKNENAIYFSDCFYIHWSFCMCRANT